jgi:hypothetical protein
MFDCSAPIQPAHRRKLFTLTGGNQMTQKFSTINDALKWCIDHPDQRLRDKDGREIWFEDPQYYDSNVVFWTNERHIDDEPTEGRFMLERSIIYERLHLPTLRPVEAEPEKPTLENLAALENWDWFNVTMPDGSCDKNFKHKIYDWTHGFYFLWVALSAGWPVEFGRDEK